MKRYEASVGAKVLSGAAALAAIVTLIFGVDALREGLIALATTDLLVSGFALGIILARHRWPSSMAPNWVFVVIMTAFFVYLFASGGHGGTGLLFMLLVPLTAPLFLGWKSGVAVSLTGLTVCAIVAVWGGVTSPFPGIPEGTLLARLAAIYLVSLFLSSLYDSGMQKAYAEEARAREALRESEEKYRTILDETGDGYFELDLTGNLTFANDAMLRLLGCSGEEAAGLSYKAFAPTEEEAKAGFEAYNRMYRTGEPLLDYHSRIVRRDGSHGFGETSAFLTRNEDGEIVGFRGVRRDITEREQAEEALRQSEEKHRTILEQMEDSYFEVDLGGHITFVNSSTCRDLGYSEEELIGMSYKQFTAEEDIESVFGMFGEVYLAGTPNKGFSWKTVRKDGNYGYAETSVSPLRNDKGEITGFRGVGRDIAERKRAEEALKTQTAYFQQLFDSSPDAIVMMDTDDRVLRVNRGFEALFGYGAEEVTGRSLDEFIIPEDFLEESFISFETVRHGGVVRKEIERRRKDGSLIDVSVVGYPIEIDGRFAGMYVTYTDITERRQQAERLIMADRLASVGEMAAGAAHELNNPLTSVIGFARLLMERDVPEDIREDLAIIHNEALRASEVTKNLLTFARKHAPVKQPNQLNSIIEDVLKLRAYEHKLSNIRVKRRLSRTLPEVNADYFQMQQVFLNIVVNAGQVMAQTNNGGTLTITTRKRNGSVVASISDDGPGISREHLGQIFNPFFTTKEPGKGTGLGLSICYGIVTEHEGRIRASSEPGKGATFSVELPVNGVR